MSQTETGNRRAPSLFRAGLDAPLSNYYLVIVSVGLLLVLGSMMVLSASSVYAETNTASKDPYYFFTRHVIGLLIGVVLAAVTLRFRPDKLRNLGWIALLATLLLLVLVQTRLGIGVGGNRNWLQLGPIQLQPSEFAKLTIAVWGAQVLHQKERLLDQPRHLLFPFLPGSLLLIALVILQRDLGTAMVLILITVAVLWVVGASWRILAALGLGALATVISLVLVSANRVNRFLAFMNPEEELLGRNMQPTMGLYALASGGWWGSGLGASRQKWGSLREAHTDYIFAIIGEELGLVGTLLTLFLFACFAFAGYRCALNSDTLFTRVAAAAVTTWITGQALVNIAVVLRLIPVMGVPLPFISYGRSSLLATLLAVGVLLACCREEPAARQMLKRRRRASTKMTAVVGR